MDPSGGGTAGGLLAVHAHPDDETLSTGALLATWARAGRPVAVVTCTRGERGEVIDTAAHPTGVAHLEGDGPGFAAHREGELVAALAALDGGSGRIDQLFLDAVGPRGEALECPVADRFVDSGMAWVAPGVAGPSPDAPPTAFSRVALDDAARRLAAVVRSRRPAVVATYEPGGGYGHPDHVRTHEVTVRALELAADPASPVVGEPWRVPERWEAVAPVEEVRAARRALAADGAARRAAAVAGLTFPGPDENLPPLARDGATRAGDAAVRVDVAPVLDRLVAAMHAHATQVQGVDVVATTGVEGRDDGAGSDLLGRYALSNDVLAPILAHETYLRGVAPQPAPVGSRR